MNVNWIKITDRAREGLTIINNLNYDVFETVLDYVYKNMNFEDQSDEPENALEQLEKFVGITRHDFLLLIKTMSYVLKRISTILILPTKLEADIRERLNLSDDKIDAIMKVYIKQTNVILQDFNKNSKIYRMGYALRLELSSSLQEKERILLSNVQLKTYNSNTLNSNDVINLEMNHEELLELYNQTEIIQNELDTMRSY